MEESAPTQLLIPDIMTPAQYYEGVHRDDPETQGIKRLMFAVLADAVRCFQTYADARSRAGRRMFGEAEWWIWDRHSEGPFTFQAICETLGIEPDRLRDGLHQWRVQQSRGMNPRPLARRAQVRSVGQIGSAPRPQRQRHAADLSRNGGMEIPSLVAGAARNGHSAEHPAPSDVCCDDPAPASLAPDGASDASYWP